MFHPQVNVLESQKHRVGSSFEEYVIQLQAQMQESYP